MGASRRRSRRLTRRLPWGAEPLGGADRIPAGAEIAVSDLADRGSLSAVFEGIDAVFLLAGYLDTRGILEDLKSSGVTKVVLLSSGAVVGGDLDNAVVRYNDVSEGAVRDSGLRWTMLRPSGFMSNAMQWLPALRNGNVFHEPFADAPITVIDPADIASVAALPLTTDGHEGRSHWLTGPEPLLPADRARILGRVLHRDIEIVAETDAAAWHPMTKDMPEPMVDAFFQFSVAVGMKTRASTPPCRRCWAGRARASIRWLTLTEMISASTTGLIVCRPRPADTGARPRPIRRSAR